MNSSAKPSCVGGKATEEKELLSLMGERCEKEQAQLNEMQLEIKRRKEKKLAVGKKASRNARSIAAVSIDDN